MRTPLAYPVGEAGQAVGVSRTRIFEAIKNKELTARKAGRATLIEVEELQRWLRSLPTRGAERDAGLGRDRGVV
jgi:excisionase family DNA binding protein